MLDIPACHRALRAARRCQVPSESVFAAYLSFKKWYTEMLDIPACHRALVGYIISNIVLLTVSLTLYEAHRQFHIIHLAFTFGIGSCY